MTLSISNPLKLINARNKQKRKKESKQRECMTETEREREIERKFQMINCTGQQFSGLEREGERDKFSGDIVTVMHLVILSILYSSRGRGNSYKVLTVPAEIHIEKGINKTIYRQKLICTLYSLVTFPHSAVAPQ